MTSLMSLGFVLALLAAPAQQKEAPRPAPPQAPAAAPAGPTPEEIEAARQAKIREGREALLRAYRREYAFLDDEEKALQARLEEVAAEKKNRIDRAELEVKAFQEQLSEMQDRIALTKAALRETEEKAARLREVTDGTEAILSQAFASLERYGVKPPEGGETKPGTPEHRDRSLAFAFAKAGEVVKGLSALRVEPDTYFRPDGAPVEGKVLKVGGVASLALEGAVRGPLLPAGGGRMKILANVPSGMPKAEDVSAPVLPLFLYESPDKSVEERKAQTWGQHVAAGGKIAWVIVLLGLGAVGLLLARTGLLLSAASNARALLDRVTPALLRGRTDEALSIAASSRGAAARVLQEALEHPHADSEVLETVLSERILKEGLRMDRFDVSVTVAAAVAPLLGLLGTVTGMIATFDVITVHGTGDPKTLSGGISEALVTTELGLIVAIPALLAGSLLSGWGERIKSGMDHVALRMVHLREGSGEPVRAGGEEREGEEDVAPAGARG